MTDRTPPPTDLATIERPARRAELRIRFGRALGRGTAALVAALALAAMVLALRKTGVVHERPARIALALLALGPLAVAAVAFARSLPSRAGAVALDRFHGLSDRLSSALSF